MHILIVWSSINSIDALLESDDFNVDNAAMIAWAAMYRFLAKECDDFSIEPKPKWNIEEPL